MRITPTADLRERTSFIGRKREKELLLQEIERGAALLTISGPSGLGKTRLAQQVAQQAAHLFEREGGTWFCDLTQCTTTADVELEVARVLGIPQLFGDDLVRAIGKRGKMLLVLDNFDRVAAALGELLGPWIDRCINLQVIGTSIVPAHLLGEFHLPLGPLEHEDAVELYLERARRASMGYTLPEGEEELVEELVRRLDRIPLAIELASARIRVFSPRALLSRLDERLELLRGGVPERHGSLEQALSLTWSLLGEREKLLLTRASIQPNGFGLEVARACLDGSTEFETLELVDGLRAKALLHVHEGEHPRFFLFESVQLYARQFLEAAGDEEATYRRQRDALLEQAEAWAQAIESPKIRSALAWFQAERSTLIAILHRDAKHEPDQAIRAGIPLLVPFEREGYPPVSFPTLELLLSAARQVEDPVAIGRVLLFLGRARLHHGQSSAAREAFREGLELAKRGEDPALIGEFHLVLSDRLVLPHSDDVTDTHIEEALRISREHGLPKLESAILSRQGTKLLRRGKIHEAVQHFWRAVEILRAHDLRWHKSLALSLYGAALGMEGRIAEARRILLEAKERASALQSNESSILVNLAGVELAAGDLDAAEAYAQEGLAHSKQLGSFVGEAHSLSSLGAIALYRDDPRLGLRYMRAATTIFEEHNDGVMVSLTSNFLAIAEAKCGSLERGREIVRRGREFLLAKDYLQDRASFEITESLLDVIEAQGLRSSSPSQAERMVREARETLVTAREGAPSRENAFAVIRLLELELERWEAEPEEAQPTIEQEPLRVDPNGEWFELPGKERVELRHRTAIRRLLAALVQARLEKPGEALSTHELFDAGWPDVEIQTDAAVRRVYITIWTLRDLGLGELVLNQTGGYLLDEHVPLVLEDGRESKYAPAL